MLIFALLGVHILHTNFADGKIKVLVVEDETAIRKFININLQRSGFDVYEADSGEKAIELLGKINPHVVVLDIMLPGIDGFEVCTKVREHNNQVIIIMLTAKSQDMDKIMGLELGADDYMVKPFNPLELIARIKTIMRRVELQSTNKNIIKHGNIELDIKGQRVYKNGKEVDLTPTEFAILKLFMENPGKAINRDEILNTIWGKNYFGDLKTIDVYVRRIREKIEDVPSKPVFIETVWGTGYRWNEDEHE